MRIFFSGGTGKLTSEFLIANLHPHVMLTYVEVNQHPTWVGWAKDRLDQHIQRKQGADPNIQPNAYRAMKKQQKRRLPNTLDVTGADAKGQMDIFCKSETHRDKKPKRT